MPSEQLTDLWEIRACFQNNFRRSPCFIVSEHGDEIVGLLPLSRIEEDASYAFFPGETWNGHTWLEQNRIISASNQVLQDMLDAIPGQYHLRYLLPTNSGGQGAKIIDEVGYLFCPGQYDYDMEKYFGVFSHKSAKRIRRDIASLAEKQLQFRYDDLNDFDEMVRLNIERFGENSYYFDPRFQRSFRDLMHYLDKTGRLRMTGVVIAGKTAAVDMGAIYNGTYTLLAGGTNAAFPGVAKLINTHHMQRACIERIEAVDFLCGNFSWKTMFHLSPRPLYMFTNIPQAVTVPADTVMPLMEKSRMRRSAYAG